jgi:hypothetical protein
MNLTSAEVCLQAGAEGLYHHALSNCHPACQPASGLALFICVPYLTIVTIAIPAIIAARKSMRVDELKATQEVIIFWHLE